jgi:16S rRNA (guanine527-N7)-methyltransferase
MRVNAFTLVFIMRTDFIEAVKTHQPLFGLQLSEGQIDRLADYYDLVQENNALLHLVGPGSPEEFAIRHILESLTILEYLPDGASFADVGAGAGLPSMPCLLVRPDLTAVLIESKLKKAAFLKIAAEKLELKKRVQVFDVQFSEVKPSATYITCRALDKFTAKLPQLLRWSGELDMLLFGGNSLRDALTAAKVQFAEKLLPMSEQRFLFHLPRGKR